MKRKNKNSDFIEYYVFNDINIIISENKLLKKADKNKKDKKQDEKSNKAPIKIIIGLEEEENYLIEIKKNVVIFDEGEIY